MKLNAGKRILMFFHWLFSLLICAAFAAYIIKPDWAMGIYDRVTGNLASTQVMIIGIAILAIYVILTVVQACIIFHRARREDRGFITVDSSDSGRVRIAVSAIEQMVRQSVTSIDGITDMRIGIENKDDAIGININATLQNGAHVPTITMNMQRAIRQFVEMNCGVAVRSVSISINAVASAGEGGRWRGRRKDGVKPADMPMPAYAPVSEAAKEPIVPASEPQNEPEPEPVYVPTTEPEPEPEIEPMDEGTPAEPIPEAEAEAEEDFIPDPQPIVLHFDHLPRQTDEAPTEEPDETEIAGEEQ